jgi:sugar lactone lactonase YvrE
MSPTWRSSEVERGELILQVPGDNGNTIGLPSAVFVTPDGRLLIGDAGQGRIRAFTCDGQEIYALNPVPDKKIAPQGFALDNVADPGLKKPNGFDPSGVPNMGRIHVADGRHGVIHMFNPLGDYIDSYPDDEQIEAPSSIAIATDAERIFVADSPAKLIHVFTYGEK